MRAPMRCLVALALASGLSACRGSSKGPSAEVPRRTATPVPAGATRGVTSFLQAVPREDGLAEAFPGAANTWTLDGNFALVRAWAAQYVGEGALDLWVGTVGTTTAAGLFDAWVAAAATTTPALREFPSDQTAAGVTWLTPLFGPGDGVPVAATRPGFSGLPVIFGEGSGLIPGGADSRLVRRLVLAPDQEYTVAWRDIYTFYDAISLRLDGATSPPDGPRYQVVLRDPSTGDQVGAPLYESIFTGGPTFTHAAPVSTAPGSIPAGPVDLSFELRTGGWGWASIDAVTVTTLGGFIALPDGDFEGLDLGPWTAVAPPRSQQVRSASRILAVDPAGATTLAVTRTFLAPPAAPWARMVDVFRNDGAAPVARSVVYLTHLGAGAPWTELVAGGRAAVARDRNGLERDLGIVFGTGLAAFDDADPTVAPYVFLVHDVVVPARGEIALVHFAVQLGQGSTGADHAPDGTRDACQAIAAGIRSDPQYLSDLEPGVLEILQNF